MKIYVKSIVAFFVYNVFQAVKELKIDKSSDKLSSFFARLTG